VGGSCERVIKASDWLKIIMEKKSVEKSHEITRLKHLGNGKEAMMMHGQLSFKARDLSLDRIRGLFAHSGDLIEFEDMAYLFATGKSELEIRNALALYLHRELEPSQHALREWKRHDLAVLDASGQPMLLIEGKVWSHTDVLSPKKLLVGEKSIKTALENDLKKLVESKKKYPSVRCFITIILFSIDVTSSTADLKTSEIVKYEALHRRGIKKYKTLNKLEDEGRAKLREFLDGYGESMFLPMWRGIYHGMEVRSEVFILEPDFGKVSDN
jgi:hypothetical protein